MSSSSVALTKNLYLSVSLPLCRNCRDESWVITTIGLSTSMLKWSIMRSSISRELPISLPALLRILKEPEPLALIVLSTVITSPWFIWGSNASLPTFRMLTSTLAKFEPSRMKPFKPLSLLSFAPFFVPRHTMSAVSTADLPEPFSPTMKLMRGPSSTSRCWWHMKLVTLTFRIVPLPCSSTVSGSGALRFSDLPILESERSGGVEPSNGATRAPARSGRERARAGAGRRRTDRRHAHSVARDEVRRWCVRAGKDPSLGGVPSLKSEGSVMS